MFISSDGALIFDIWTLPPVLMFLQHPPPPPLALPIIPNLIVHNRPTFHPLQIDLRLGAPPPLPLEPQSFLLL
jgi:hypothetical protein